MWDVMARKCIAHMKLNDHILVSGRLASYGKRSSDVYSGLDHEYHQKMVQKNPRMKRYSCGKSSFRIHTIGGTTGEIRRAQGNLTLNIKIQMKLSGLTLIYRIGLLDDWNSSTRETAATMRKNHVVAVFLTI
ncbi:unnamed protein product, partial [Arabidopsis halleri]